ncbi:protein adenylyltransferase SelO family protein [Microcoleus sp. AR_TQ3_B6]|uniref:protein adenylyltransferase SelO family protein n=1 Tax=Microcoleus sp. AR_TQ3_B6 TaxID=3055284 RepID=UPI00403F0F2C
MVCRAGLRSRKNDKVLPKLGLDPAQVTDEHFTEAFGKFHCVRPSSLKFFSGVISECFILPLCDRI